MLQNLVVKVTYLHYLVVLEYIVELLVDLGPCAISLLLLLDGLEILAPFWAISGVLAHLIFVLA
jgi:hypothetical protein